GDPASALSRDAEELHPQPGDEREQEEAVEDLLRPWCPEARQPAAPPGDGDAGVDLRRGEGDAEPVPEEAVDGEGDERRDRGPEERRPDDRRERLRRPGRAVEPALKVGRTEADLARHQEADRGGRNQEDEVADEE